jgi:DNA-binding transcriptional LysR family regulator
MNLRQLQAFKALIETGTVSQAARALHISQPAASKLVAKFEDTAGFTVFKRERGRLLPTPEALMLYDEVERVFAGVDEIARATRDIRELKRGKVALGVPMALACGLVQGVIDRFLRDRPEVSVSLQTRSSPRLVEFTAARRVDLAVVALMSDYPGVEMELLCRAEGVCVLPPAHRLTAADVVRAEDLHGEPFISLTAPRVSACPSSTPSPRGTTGTPV